MRRGDVVSVAVGGDGGGCDGAAAVCVGVVVGGDGGGCDGAVAVCVGVVVVMELRRYVLVLWL